MQLFYCATNCFLAPPCPRPPFPFAVVVQYTSIRSAFSPINLTSQTQTPLSTAFPIPAHPSGAPLPQFPISNPAPKPIPPPHLPFPFPIKLSTPYQAFSRRKEQYLVLMTLAGGGALHDGSKNDYHWNMTEDSQQ